jgi:threonine synthase
MRYVSTRGRADPAGFADVLLGGRAPDGGLWVPEAWPQLLPDEVAACAGRPLAATAADLLARFSGGALDPEAAAAATRDAAATFVHAGPDPLRELEPNLWLHDLTFGPTGSAADFEMQVLARLIEAEMTARRETRTVVLATAGDDGGAAVEAFAGRPHLRLIVLFPEGRLSARRLRQVTGARAGNVRAVAVDGSYEACRALADGLFADPALVGEAQLASIGAENPVRLPLQVAPWLAAAARLGVPGRSVALAAPAGEASLAVAAWAALRLGAGAGRVLVGANAHDGLVQLFAAGRFARSAAQASATPELDVDAPIAFERLYFEAVGRNPLETARAMQALDEAGRVDLPPSAAAALSSFAAALAVDGELARTLVQARNDMGELLDPATAVVVSAARRLAGGGPGPVIIPALAHPALSAEVVEAVTGETPALPRQMSDLDAREPRFERIGTDVETFKRFVRALTGLGRAA